MMHQEKQNQDHHSYYLLQLVSPVAMCLLKLNSSKQQLIFFSIEGSWYDWTSTGSDSVECDGSVLESL